MEAGLRWRDASGFAYAKIDVPVGHVEGIGRRTPEGAEPKRPMLRQHPIAVLGVRCDDGVRQTLLLILGIPFLTSFLLGKTPLSVLGVGGQIAMSVHPALAVSLERCIFPPIWMQHVGADVQDSACLQFMATFLAFGTHRPLAITKSTGF